MKIKYNKKQFKQFVKYCNYWINKLNITEYEIDFKHHDIDTAARTTYDVRAKLACIQLCLVSEGDFCLQTDLNKLACHEVLHLLLADLGYVIDQTKDFESDLAISAEHSVLQRLLKALL